MRKSLKLPKLFPYLSCVPFYTAAYNVDGLFNSGVGHDIMTTKYLLLSCIKVTDQSSADTLANISMAIGDRKKDI